MHINPRKTERKTGGRHILRRTAVILLVSLFATTWLFARPWLPTLAAPALTITPLTWDLVGLDTPNVNAGFATYPVGARVCNTGDSPATNVHANFAWDSANSFINLLSTATLDVASIAPSACSDYYFWISVTRDPAAYNATRQYHITATADGPITVTTPTNRQVRVASKTAWTNLEVTRFSGPTQVASGSQVNYVVQASTHGDAYAQLEHFLTLAPNMVRLVAARSTYSSPAGATNDRVYADACGWDPDLTSPTYGTCKGPQNYPGGVISGTLVTTYTLQILATGTFTLTTPLYGLLNGNLVYNADFGQDKLVVTSVAQLPTDTPTATVTHTQTITPTITSTGPTPTRTLTPTRTQTSTPTGTTTPRPNATKAVTLGASTATVGTTLTFTIRVSNSGTAPSFNTVVRDGFVGELDVTGVSTSKGTHSLSGRTVTVVIGVLNPGEVVNITITTRVNNQAAAGTNQKCNTATISYNWVDTNTATPTRSVTPGATPTGATATATSSPTATETSTATPTDATLTATVTNTPLPTIASNQSCFYIKGSSTLPNTGEEYVPPASVTPSPWTVALPILLAALGLAALRLSLSFRALKKTAHRLVLASGFLLISVGLVGILAACNTSQKPERSIDMQVGTPEVAHPTASATVNPLAVEPVYLFSTPRVVETLPKYPVPTLAYTVTPAPGEETSDDTPIQRIVIPSLGVDTVVAYVPYDGMTWLIQGLRQEVAWLGETSRPGQGGNTGLAGHVTVKDEGRGPFYYISSLKAGDTILLYTERKIYTYTVRNQEVVDEADLSPLGQTDYPQLTLVTCVDWNADLKYYLRRLAVFADLEKSVPIY